MTQIYVLSVYSPFNWKRPLSYISSAIRKVTGYKWHHSAFLLVTENENWIIESDVKGVVKTPFNAWTREKEICGHEIECNIVELNEKIHSRVGIAGYDFRSLLFHQLINETLGIWVGPTKEGCVYDEFTCSEFVAWSLGWEDAYKVTPEQIHKKLPITFQGKAKEFLWMGK
jgi:hypothetical protein